MRVWKYSGWLNLLNHLVKSRDEVRAKLQRAHIRDSLAAVILPYYSRIREYMNALAKLYLE